MNRIEDIAERFKAFLKFLHVKENIENLYEDFYEMYKDADINESAQNCMFNAFLSGSINMTNPHSCFNIGLRAKQTESKQSEPSDQEQWPDEKTLA